ncbi:hypothetical protein CPB85DRAFT_371399 [Mucidula mucida]|nr:hypothetical protein CPB85DRAFT_371399 [Mucidula mucida]
MLFMILLLGAISFDFLVFVACRLLHSAILFPNIPESPPVIIEHRPSFISLQVFVSNRLGAGFDASRDRIVRIDLKEMQYARPMYSIWHAWSRTSSGPFHKSQ